MHFSCFCALRQVTVLHTEQVNVHPVDVNKDRCIQTPIVLLIFEDIGHVYSAQCGVLGYTKTEFFKTLFCPKFSSKNDFMNNLITNQNKGNEAYNNMIADFALTHTHDPWDMVIR